MAGVADDPLVLRMALRRVLVTLKAAAEVNARRSSSEEVCAADKALDDAEEAGWALLMEEDPVPVEDNGNVRLVDDGSVIEKLRGRVTKLETDLDELYGRVVGLESGGGGGGG